MKSRLPILTMFILALAHAAFAQTNVWDPIPANELQMTKPVVEPGADAEVLFWEVRLNDKLLANWSWETTLDHHIRIKIFTERGRELNSKVDISYEQLFTRLVGVEIKDISARTVKPDGTTVILKPEDIFDRDIVKSGGIKFKAKSFAVPGIEIGTIIEYKWREIRRNLISASPIVLAREIPVQYVKYWIKPANAPIGMRLHSVNTAGHFVKEPGGYYSTTMTNVPAFAEEPQMPSRYEVIPWVLMYYDNDDENLSAEQYWLNRAKKTWEQHKDVLKPKSEVREAAEKAIAGTSDPIEKIRRIHGFCRSTVSDINDDGAGFTPQQRDEYKPNKSPADALKRRVGTWHDVDVLFASMLVSVGFDARFANVATKRDARFNRNLGNDYFVRSEIVAVRNGNGWLYFDLSDRNLPFGMISSNVEGQSVLISDERQAIWDTVPVAPASASNQKRVADVALDGSGAVTGTVSIEYTGHLAAYYREFYDGVSAQAREKSFDELVKRNIGDASKATNIIFENIREPERPLILKFSIEVPAYADRTGKRLFIRPNFFKRNANALFPSATRRYDVMFPYAWSETDTVRLKIPTGFNAESLETPKRITETKSDALLESTLTEADPGTLLYERRFRFGKADGLYFYDFNYGGVKRLFDLFHSADSFSIALRETKTEP